MRQKIRRKGGGNPDKGGGRGEIFGKVQTKSWIEKESASETSLEKDEFKRREKTELWKGPDSTAITETAERGRGPPNHLPASRGGGERQKERYAGGGTGATKRLAKEKANVNLSRGEKKGTQKKKRTKSGKKGKKRADHRKAV